VSTVALDVTRTETQQYDVWSRLTLAPGRYEVRHTVEGKTLRQPLDVAADPRAPVARKTLEDQLAFYREVVSSLEAATDARVEIDAAAGKLPGAERFQKGSSEDNVGAIGGVLGLLATDLEGADAAPTRPQVECLADYDRRLRTALEHWRAFRSGAASDPGGPKR
jgi:hypothetical protein